MFKKIAIKTGVLTTVFILAVIVSSYVTNRGNTDMSADMGGATLPRISFMTEGYEVNSLPGYKSDMTLTSMRDTLTPVTNNQLDMNIAKYDNQIQKVYWQVCDETDEGYRAESRTGRNSCNIADGRTDVTERACRSYSYYAAIGECSSSETGKARIY